MKIEQLDFLGKFDRESVKQERLVQLILAQIRNVKFLRSRIRCSTEYTDTEKEAPLLEVNNILYNLATIAWKRSRWIPEYKYEHLTYFLDLTLDSKTLNCTVVITKDEVREVAKNVGEQTTGALAGQKALLKEEERHVGAIASNFKSLQYLLK